MYPDLLRKVSPPKFSNLRKYVRKNFGGDTLRSSKRCQEVANLKKFATSYSIYRCITLITCTQQI